MTVTLGQLILGIYGILFTGTMFAWKNRRKKVMFFGSIVPACMWFTYTGLERSNNHRQQMLATLTPQWTILYDSLKELNNKPDARVALIKSFKEACPNAQLSPDQYALFVKLSNASIELSDRLDFTTKPTTTAENTNTMLAKLSVLNEEITVNVQDDMSTESDQLVMAIEDK